MRMWNDEHFRALSQPKPSAQFLWMYLLTGPPTIAAPGVVRATRGGLADELGWSAKDFDRCWTEIESAHMGVVDWKAGVIFLPNAAFYNPPAGMNAIKTWARSLEHIVECDLKRRIINHLLRYLTDYSDAFGTDWQGLFPNARAEGMLHATAEGTAERNQETNERPVSYPGTGAGVNPYSPLDSGRLPTKAAGDVGDPAPPVDGAGGSPPSPPDWHPDKGEDAGRTDGTDEPFALESRVVGGDSTGAGGGGDGPMIFTDGTREPGCTMCGEKVAGLMFRRAVGGTHDGLPIAAFCWGCHNLGCRNPHRLPVPGAKSRAPWKRFEWVFPESKRMRKRDREKFAADAAARTRSTFEGRVAAADRQKQDAESAARREALQCSLCGDLHGGLLFRESPGGWEAGLCPKCGGPSMHRDPPRFMGPALPVASENGAWKPWPEVPGSTMREGEWQMWRRMAIDRGKQRPPEPAAGAEPAPEPEPETPPAEPSGGTIGTTAGSPIESPVSGEPPPI